MLVWPFLVDYEVVWFAYFYPFIKIFSFRHKFSEPHGSPIDGVTAATSHKRYEVMDCSCLQSSEPGARTHFMGNSGLGSQSVGVDCVEAFFQKNSAVCTTTCVNFVQTRSRQMLPNLSQLE